MTVPTSDRLVIEVDEKPDTFYLWYPPGLDVLVQAGGPDGLEAMNALRQIPEDEWATMVTPFIEPPPLGGN